MAEVADTRAEAARQRELERSLGQVRCVGVHEDWWLPATGCPHCGAAL